jgi:hypothetical protein
MNEAGNIRGPSWRAVEIVLGAAKRSNRRLKSLGTNAPEKEMNQLNDAIERVEQMLEREPERFMEV